MSTDPAITAHQTWLGYVRLSTRDPQQIPDTQAGRGWSTGDHGAVSTAC